MKNLKTNNTLTPSMKQTKPGQKGKDWLMHEDLQEIL